MPVPPANRSIPDGPQPQITFSKTVEDFGTSVRGDLLETTFPFRNTGEADLVLQDVKTTCGCTVAEWTEDPIPPDGTAFIKAKLNTAGRKGHTRKTISVYSNDPASPQRLLVETNIEVLLSFRQPTLDFREVSCREEVERRMNLEGKRADDVMLSNPRLASARNRDFYELSIADDREEDHGQLGLVVKKLVGAPIGKIAEQVIVDTSLEEMPKIELTLSGDNLGPVKYSPQFLRFRDDVYWSGGSERLRLTATEDIDFKVLKAHHTIDGINTAVDEIKTGREYEVTVTVPRDFKGDNISGYLMVTTDNAEMPLIKVRTLKRGPTTRAGSLKKQQEDKQARETGASSAAGATGVVEKPVAELGKVPRITFDTEEKNLGEMWSGEKRMVEFTVKNEGDSDLLIESVGTNCNCARPMEYPTEAIAPGGSGTILVKFDSTGNRYHLRKSVTVHSNDPARPNVSLALEAELKLLVGFKSRDYDFGRIPYNTEEQRTLWLQGEGLSYVKVDNPRLRSSRYRSYLDFNVIEEGQGEDRKLGLEITKKPGFPFGDWTDELLLDTDQEAAPQVEIVLQGKSVGPISHRPEKVYFPRTKSGGERKYVVDFYSETGEKFHVLESRSSISGLVVTTEEKVAGEEYRVTVKIPSEFKGGSLNGYLVVKTDNPEMENISVQITGSVLPSSKAS